MDRLIRGWAGAAEFSGLSKTSIWRAIMAGTFPAPLKVGANAVAWKESDLVEWRDRLPTAEYAGRTAPATAEA